MNNSFKNFQLLKFIYKYIKPFNITGSIFYWSVILFLFYQSISNLISPENFIYSLKNLLALNENILILISISLQLLQTALALMLILKLHLKASLITVIISLSLISFIYFCNSVEIIPVIEFFPKIIIINQDGVIKSLLNILFFIIALIISRIINSQNY
ncbi:MAG: hypothetical protein WHS65_10380 [Melioribacteraceae bacterium]